MSSSAKLAHRISIAVVVVGLSVGCGPPETGPGPEGAVGPEKPAGQVADEEGVPGSEDITTEMLDVGSFDRVVFSSEGSVVLTQSNDSGLSVSADDNLHQYIEAVVEDSTLTISTIDQADIAPSQPIVFEIGVTEVSLIELRGVGTITTDGLDGVLLSVTLTGAGDITIDDLQFERVIVDHQGVGIIRLQGRADEQHVSVSGVGEYEGGELISRVAVLDVSGTAEAIVWATEALSCVVSESGLVKFFGKPDLDQQISGSGSIVAMGEK